MAYYNIDQTATDAANTLSYHKSIASMMHGFGDNANPNPLTVSLVESITMQQMHGIIAEAMKNVERRNSNKLNSEDIIFLMRRNRSKLRQVLRYYKVMDTIGDKSKVLSDQYVPNALLEDDIAPNKNHRNKTIKNLMKLLDETSELMEPDQSLNERNLRLYRLSEGMSLDKYLALTKSRSVTFVKNCNSTNHVSKFKQWLNLGSSVTVKSDVVGLLNYLAHQTVGVIVDLAFLVRQDAKRNSWNPLSRLEGGNYCNPSSLSNSVFVKTGQEGVSPLTVCEVREAMRRFSTQRIGIQGRFTRNIRNTASTKFLAME